MSGSGDRVSLIRLDVDRAGRGEGEHRVGAHVRHRPRGNGHRPDLDLIARDGQVVGTGATEPSDHEGSRGTTREGLPGGVALVVTVEVRVEGRCRGASGAGLEERVERRSGHRVATRGGIEADAVAGQVDGRSDLRNGRSLVRNRGRGEPDPGVLIRDDPGHYGAFLVVVFTASGAAWVSTGCSVTSAASSLLPSS